MQGLDEHQSAGAIEGPNAALVNKQCLASGGLDVIASSIFYEWIGSPFFEIVQRITFLGHE